MSGMFLNSRIPAFFLALAASVAGYAQTPDEHLQSGLAALQANDLQTAVSELQAAKKLNANDGRIRLGLAEAYRLAGRPDDAEAETAGVAEMAEDEPLLLRGLSVYFQNAGDPAEAARFEAGYARAFPDDVSGFGRAAAFYLEAGDAARAAEFASSGLERRKMASLYDLLGKAQAELGQFDAAADAFGQAVKLRPYDEDYRYNLGHLHLRAQRFEQALTIFGEAQTVFDKSPRLAMGVGIAHYGMRRFAMAVDAFLEAARLAPSFPQPHYFLGRTLTHASGRIAEVVAVQKAFAEAQPDNYLGSFLYGQALLAAMPPEGDDNALAVAEKALRRSIVARDDFWESHFELGALLEKQRRYDEARPNLERAVELNPNSSKPHYRLSRVYARLGEKDLAARERELHEKLTEAERAAMKGGMSSSLEEPLIE